MSINQLEESVHEEMIRFYRNANIPTKGRKVVAKQIANLYTEYQSVKASLNRKSRAMKPTEKMRAEEC